jgi:TATA-box binding protein (TBP) (component of TFIID and TFIIIB)
MRAELKAIVEAARPIRKEQNVVLPKIENVVSTAMLLPDNSGYRLPLDAIAMRLKCSQYAPAMFAANIIKLNDSITDSTVLIFASGKIVVVASLTENHTRYVSQLVRVIIEQVPCTTLAPEGQVLVNTTLAGRLCFDRCRVHNIVGSGHLGCRINLQAMCDAAPMCCKWFPDLFPGLKCKIWLTATYGCECSAAAEETASSLAAKCSCAVKVLIFDSGQLVITGAKRVTDINGVFFRIKNLATQYAAAAAAAGVSSASGGGGGKRFYERMSAMMVPTGLTGKKTKPLVRPTTSSEMTEKNAIAMVLDNLPSTTHSGGGLAPIIQMIDSGRVDQVCFMLQIEPTLAETVRDNAGRTLVERIMAMQNQTAEHRKILALLQSKKKS